MITEPNEVYHANSAISHSKLELFRRRPISYYRRFISKTVERPEATEAFRIGIEGKTKTGAPQYFPVTLAERSRRGREYPRAAMRNDKNLYEVTARDKSFGMKTLEQIGF